MRKPIDIFLCSDVHLDRDVPDFDRIVCRHADVIVLAGDIGNPFSKPYKDFLQHCSSKALLVILVPGNHEFRTGKHMDETKDYMKKLCLNFCNIKLLDNSVIHYNDFAFVGSTLWANIDESVDGVAQLEIRDYSTIPGFTPYSTRHLYTQNAEFLCRTLKDYTQKHIVITHFPPVMSDCVLNPRYRYDQLRSYYYNNLDGLVDQPNICAWFYGHTHHSIDTVRKPPHCVRIISNQYRSPGYSARKIIRFP